MLRSLGTFVAIVVLSGNAGMCARASAEETSGAALAEVTTEGTLPFSEEELRTALQARLNATPEGARRYGRLRVKVSATGDVSIEGTISRHVSWGGLSGTSAARRVALEVVALTFGGAPGLPDSTPAPPTLATAAHAKEAPARALQQKEDATAPNAVYRLVFSWTTALTRSANVAALWGPALEVNRRSRSVSLGMELGLAFARHSDFDQITLEALRPALRAALPWRQLEFGVSVAALPYRVSGLADHAGVLWSSAADLRAWVPVARSLSLVAAIQMERYYNRLAIDVLGDPVFWTPTWATSASLGLAWSMGGRP